MRHAALIATCRILPSKGEAFSGWLVRHDSAVAGFPGYVGSDTAPPADQSPGGAWTIVVHFESEDDLRAWKESPDRGCLLADLLPLIQGGTLDETVGASAAAPSTEVTEVVFSKVMAGKAVRYREWAGRMQAAQAKYPGYLGMYLQPPAQGDRGGHWTSILRFDNAAHLEAWMNAPERKALLGETGEFIESEELMHLSTAFPGWVPLDPLTGKGPPNWKTAMLVLLGLFPIVILEMKFLRLDRVGLPISPATFVGNVISVALTSFATMPLFVRFFNWWLFPKSDTAATTAKGTAIICAFYAAEILLLWNLIPL